MSVIDASVYVAVLKHDEPGHSQSQAWFSQAVASREGVAAPAILLAELGSALSRNTRNPNRALEAVEQLEASGYVRFYAVTQTLASRSAMLAAAHRLHGCDSIYVALAEHLGEPLVTLDEEQLARGAAVVATMRPQ